MPSLAFPEISQHFNLQSSSNLLLRSPLKVSHIFNPKEYIYGMQTNNFFAIDDYSDELNTYLAQIIDFFENLHAVPLNFKTTCKDLDCSNNNEEVRCQAKPIEESIEEKVTFKRSRPCEEVLESEVVASERRSQMQPNVQVGQIDRCVQNVEGVSGMRKKVKRDSFEGRNSVEKLSQIRTKQRKILAFKDLSMWENQLLENVKEEAICLAATPSEPIRGEFVIYQDRKQSIPRDQNENRIHALSEKHKLIGKVQKKKQKKGCEDKQRAKLAEKMKLKKTMKGVTGISSFMSTERCQSVIRKYQLLL